MATVTLTNGPDDYTDPLGQSNRIEGLDGDDIIHARDGDDVLIGGAGADMMFGGLGDDLYVVDDAGDVVVEGRREGIDLVRSSVSFQLPKFVENLTLTGSGDIEGKGNGAPNHIIGNSGDNVLSTGPARGSLGGVDLIEGGDGDDTYVIKSGFPVTLIEQLDQGLDTVLAYESAALPDNFERLILKRDVFQGNGNSLDNVIIGNDADNFLSGIDGNDTIKGNGGDDMILGGDGADVLVGGGDSDTFQFFFASNSPIGRDNSDVIKDFEDGVDQIDLTPFEQDTHLNFHYIGAAPFSKSPGELHIVAMKNFVLVEVDVDGNGGADFQIQLQGSHMLTRGDFIL